MKNTYRLTVTCFCPVDSGNDVYEMVVESQFRINVEDILAAVKESTKKAVYQEDLTADLARQLKARVTTVGWHSGVQTECVAP